MEAPIMTAAQRTGSGPSLAWAIAAPLGTLALAYAAWFISDRLLYVGPFDRAQFGWLVVIPMVSAAPVLAAVIWRGLDDARTLLAAAVVGLVIAATAATLFGVAIAQSATACQYGSRLSGLDMALGSALVGLVTGAGYAGSGAIGAIVMRIGHPWLGGTLAAMGGFVTLWAAAFAGFGVFGFVGICNRPL
jgi:hypothetical protein